MEMVAAEMIGIHENRMLTDHYEEAEVVVEGYAHALRFAKGHSSDEVGELRFLGSS